MMSYPLNPYEQFELTGPQEEEYEECDICGLEFRPEDIWHWDGKKYCDKCYFEADEEVL